LLELLKQKNSNGYSAPSEPNTSGETAKTVPKKPLTIPTEGTLNTDVLLEANWTILSNNDTGGSAITSYTLYWDNSDAGVALPFVTSIFTGDA
jgi:hypothetical protein